MPTQTFQLRKNTKGINPKGVEILTDLSLDLTGYSHSYEAVLKRLSFV